MKPFFSAILLMAGEGTRLPSSLPKQFHRLGEKQVYEHALQTFLLSDLFEQIILICHPAWKEKVQQQTLSSPQVQVVAGGLTRQDSSRRGLEACHPSCAYVMIHDAVRPFVSLEILERNYHAVLKAEAVDTCLTSTDTLVQTRDGLWISSIPPRSEWRRGQTPQTFSFPLLRRAHEQTQRTDASDDCQLVLELGVPVAVVDGAEENMKITTLGDLKWAQFLIEQSAQSSGTLPPSVK